ncbi:MAG: hypothetical protein J7M03_04890 [Candidatus Desulfofervidaceae bacterium]|nr:hypothetical protein [Candidatus Desulfofervidaceae bacterium]MDL1970397.1 hypothetical protein [Candidatus Desulfofervidaceae bacterium]
MAKYHIQTQQAPPRFSPPGKYCLKVDEEQCLKCKHCVREDCPYGFYKKEDGLTSVICNCHHCLYCVESCPAGALYFVINPDYEDLGDDYWTPEIITSNWHQAETGRIPVSGAGYGGPFVGKGFDDMWTDMSEIVRPTRDGIHGREYISTAIEIGRKLPCLEFDETGQIISSIPPFVEVSIPMILTLPDWNIWGKNVLLALAKAATALNTIFIMNLKDFDSTFHPYLEHLGFAIGTLEEVNDLPQGVKIVEVPFSLAEQEKVIKQVHPETIVSVKLPLTPTAKEQTLELVQQGIGVIHLYANDHGQEFAENPQFIKEVIKDIHFALLKTSQRDEVTLLASGGIAMAEHVAKTIICGADGVVLDQVMAVALECHLCKDCLKGKPCPMEINNIDPNWGAQRVVNLMGSWHSQLLEVLGAMGMRDVRRLRGELGRAIFYKDVVSEAFANIERVKI